MAEDNTPSRYDSIPVLLKKILRTLRAKDFDYSFETNDGSTYADLLSKIGVFVYNNFPVGLTGITSLTFNKLVTTSEGIEIDGATDLVTLSFPVFRSSTSGYLFLTSNPKLTSIGFPVLASLGLWPTQPHGAGSVDIYDNAVLTTLSFPVLVSSASRFIFSNSPALTSVSIPVLTSYTPVDLRCENCSLTATSVNHILARMVVCGVGVGQTIRLDGATNAAPTGQGIVDKATLQGNGATVQTN